MTLSCGMHHVPDNIIAGALKTRPMPGSCRNITFELGTKIKKNTKQKTLPTYGM